MSPGDCDFDRAFDMLLTVNLSEIIINFAGNETGLPNDGFKRRFASQEIDYLG
jgi:hypothetical protein